MLRIHGICLRINFDRRSHFANNAKNKFNNTFLYRKEMERAHSCKSIRNYYDLSTEQVIGVLQLVLCTWIAAIGC